MKQIKKFFWKARFKPLINCTVKIWLLFNRLLLTGFLLISQKSCWGTPPTLTRIIYDIELLFQHVNLQIKSAGFFFYLGFLSRTFTNYWTAGEALFISPLYYFYPLCSYWDITGMITAESSLLHIAIVTGLKSGTLGFRAQVFNHEATRPWKGCSGKCRKVHRKIYELKTSVSSLFFNKGISCGSTNLINKRLQRKCFFVSFAKFFRLMFLLNNFECMLPHL